MKLKKEIIYPIFLQCVEYTQDVFWKNIFEDLARGKAPYGSSINKNFLTSNYKDKEFSYKIDTNDPQKLHNTIYNLLTKKVGIFSKKEKIEKKIEFYDYEKQLKNKITNWKSIKKKNIKDMLLERYVINKKKQFDLTTKQSKYLLSLINICMIFKVITVDDITYENNRITNIKGIKFTKNHIIIKRNIFKNTIRITEEEKICKINFTDQWDKFLKLLRKK
jgi:hypothetical protein